MAKAFRNTKGSRKSVGRISDNAIANNLSIPISTLRVWRERRPELYWFLKSVSKEEMSRYIEISKEISKEISQESGS